MAGKAIMRGVVVRDWMLRAVVLAAACVGSHSAVSAAEAPATQDGVSISEVVARVVAHPRDEKGWEALREPGRRAEAMKLLVAAFRDPANNLPDRNSFLKPEGGRDEILEAIAGIFEDDAADILVESTKDQDWRVRVSAVEMLGWRVKSSDATRRALREAMHDPDRKVVMAAMQSLRNRPDPEAGPLALEALHMVPPLSPEALKGGPTFNGGDFAEYRERPGLIEAIGALGATGFADGIPDLLALTRGDSAYIRSESARALALCSLAAEARAKEQVVRQLKAMLDDPNHGVSVAAALALADMKDGNGVPVLLFEIRRGTRPYEEQDYRPTHWVFDEVQALEKLTGEDLGGSRGNSFWDMDPSYSDQLKAKLEIVRPLVAKMERRAAAHGFAVDGFPRLPATLAEADKAMFERGFKNWLVEPSGGTFIEFEREDRTSWGSTKKYQQRGWLFAGVGGKPAQVLLEDWAVLPAPEKSKTVDLVAETRAMIADYRAGKAPRADLIQAAWLYRLGQEALAAEELYMARGAGDRADATLDVPGADLAWRAFEGAVNAYMVRADDEALTAVERLAKLYPTYMDQFGPGTELLAELRRRQKEGTFNHAAEALPVDFEQWPADKRVARLIQDLQEVDARQMGQPGGVDVSSDARVRKLIEIGDAAVPALIDCLETDKRLTRSVSFWRDFARNRNVVAVRECALSALMSILQTQVFEPASTGDNFTSRGEGEAKSVGAQLRAYWMEYGKLPLDERMMKVLTDEKASGNATLEAARNLAEFGSRRRIGTMVWTGGVEGRPNDPNPVVAKFKNPTVAEAILAARDRHLGTLDPKENGGYELRQVEDEYAGALCLLGDRSIVPEIKRRFDAEKSVDVRRRWAMVCFGLKEEGPMREMAAGLKAGTMVFSRNGAGSPEQTGDRELRDLCVTLAESERDYGDAALAALAVRGNANHGAALRVLSGMLSSGSSFDGNWLNYPFVVRLLRGLLDDTSPTGTTYSIVEGTLRRTYEGGYGSAELPDVVAAAADGERVASAPEWACDAAVAALMERVWGVPAYHGLLTRREERLEVVRDFVDRYGGQMRVMKPAERAVLKVSAWHVEFVPAIGVDHMATAADVAAGPAIFSLGEGAAMADLRLPASGALKSGVDKGDAGRVLILQAERDGQGKIHYGIVGAHEIREVGEEALTDIKPVVVEAEGGR